MKRLPVVIACSLLLTVLMPSLGEAAAPRPVRRLQAAGIGPSIPLRCKGNAATQVHAFTVQAEWNKRVFKNTEKALVTLTETRPAPEDPLGLGLPVTSPMPTPVEGANVWTSVLTGRYPFPYGYGQTDADGKVRFKITLRLLKKAGPYDVSHYASVYTNQGGCPDIEEWGYLFESRGLTIRP
jgi:hypothetical protein